MRKFLQEQLRGRAGTAEINFGLLLALIALALMGYLTTIGNPLAAKYAVLAQTLQ